MIPVHSASEVPVPGHSSPADAEQVAQALAQDLQAIRFKKLLIYTCSGVWESDPAQLESVPFCDLISTLRSIAPTWKDLQPCLLESANRLNKSAEYTLVAHTLLGSLQPLYPDAAQTVIADPEIYEAIARQLALDPNLLRLKKLLILACANQWESDREKLDRAALAPLIQTLHALTLTQASLGFLLESLVKTLSKPEEYGLLADRLIDAMQPLYASESHRPAPSEETSIVPPSSLIQLTTAASDEITVSRSSPATKFSTIAEATAALSALLNEQNRRSNSGLSPTAPQDAEGRLAVPNELASPEFSLSQTERYGLRQTVVQASNPLRTKILLFSLLHEPFQFQQHDSILKEHDLDDLLQMTLQSYPQIANLETALHQAARHLPASEAYLQSINAVLQAVRRLAAKSSPSTHAPKRGTAVQQASRTATRSPSSQFATEAELTEATDRLSYLTALTQHPIPPVQ